MDATVLQNALMDIEFLLMVCGLSLLLAALSLVVAVGLWESNKEIRKDIQNIISSGAYTSLLLREWECMVNDKFNDIDIKIINAHIAIDAVKNTTQPLKNEEIPYDYNQSLI